VVKSTVTTKTRYSAAPLLIGTAVLRMNSGASNVILGLLLAHIAAASSRSINSVQVGLLPVVFYITELSLAPFMGAFSDRWGRRPFLIVAPLFGLVQVALLFFTPRHNPFAYLITLQLLAGVSGAISTPAALGYLADFTVNNSSMRVRIMSFYELVTTGGIAVGTVLGGVAWDHLNRAAFLCLAACYLLVILCMYLTPTIPQIMHATRLSTTAKRYLRIIRMPRLFIFIPAWLCISALVGIWLSSQLTFILSSPSHFPHQLLMGSTFGPDGGERLSFILGGYVLFFGLCLLFWAFFLHHVPRLRLMLLSVAGVYLACIALLAINHRTPGDMNAFFIWIPAMLFGIFAETSFAPAALAYLADISEDASKDRGLVMGLYSIFLSLGQILGNGLGGVFARRFGFDGLVYLTAILAFVALVSLLWLFQQDRRIRGELAIDA
jgi:MFS family permease